MKSVKILLACLVAILIFSTFTYAEVPKMINYQGKLTTPQGALFNDTLTMTFSIYADSTGGTALWTETQTSVKVEFGVFSVLLGSVIPIPNSVFDGNVRYLGVKVGDDSEMTPRKAIVSVGYAYYSGTADTAYFVMPDADWMINGDTIYHLNGNVGIGTMNPDEKLDVQGIIRTNNYLRLRNEMGDAHTDLLTDAGGNFDLKNWEGTVHLFIKNNDGKVGIGTTNPDRPLHVHDKQGLGTGLKLSSSAINSTTLEFDASTYAHIIVGGNPAISITPSGDVGIGTTSPTYKLDVNGDINVAGSYNVKKGGVDYNHPDYVFEPDYKLMSLDNLKEYVFKHKCLPKVVSAEDVKENNGFKMDELLIQMLEKIEEQTLYIFQLEERIADLEKR